VTALCAFDRSVDKRKMLISGDASGEMIVSEVSYHLITGKIERVDILFKRRSHTGQITKIEKFSQDDIVVTSSYDNSIMFWDIEREQKLLHLTEHDQPVQCFQFVDDFNYLVSATKQDLIIWNVTCDVAPAQALPSSDKESGSSPRKDNSSTAMTRFSLKAKVLNAINVEEKGSTFANARVFSTNLRFDYICFVSVASDIKLLNVLTGKYIGDIDGAHYKGTSNFGVLLNSGPTSKIKTTLSKLNQVLSTGTQKDMLALFVEQLNDYIVLSCSVKDKLRAWKFDDAFSSPISQANCLGGYLDAHIYATTNRTGEVCLLVCGNCSNKIEIFTLS
jgi:WD40 repeat protein